MFNRLLTPVASSRTASCSAPADWQLCDKNYDDHRNLCWISKSYVLLVVLLLYWLVISFVTSLRTAALLEHNCCLMQTKSSAFCSTTSSLDRCINAALVLPLDCCLSATVNAHFLSWPARAVDVTWSYRWNGTNCVMTLSLSHVQHNFRQSLISILLTSAQFVRDRLWMACDLYVKLR